MIFPFYDYILFLYLYFKNKCVPMAVGELLEMTTRFYCQWSLET